MKTVTLLAYSLRRAWGSLLVFLVVVWLLLFAVAHIRPVPSPRSESAPSVDLSWNTLQLAWARAWNVAAIELGASLVVVLGLAAVVHRLRLHPGQRR